jgi:hypothetical protein
MNQDTPTYYRPYDSGDDTDNTTDSGSEDYDSDDLPEFEDPRIRREEDPRYAIIRAAGPNFNTSAEQLKYMEHAPGSAYYPSTNITSLSNLVYLNPPKTTQTSLFCIKSVNRDASVWPTPFNFQLKTPRVYKNVTKFQLVQISFPNNTQNFINSPAFTLEFVNVLLNQGVPEECLSTCVTLSGCKATTESIGVAELGRLNEKGEPMMTTISIPKGFYENQELAREFTKNANNTPPFNLISFEEFKYEFKIHRDVLILFNEPGEYFQTNVAKQMRAIGSKNDIMNTYYSQQHIDSLHTITDKIAFNAYYYPILKELCADEIAKPFLKTGGYSFEQVKLLVLGQFLGLNSDIYYNLCLINQGTLNEYRKLFTFQLRPINKYIFTYNEDLRQFGCIHDCLHTSIQNDINSKYNSIHNHAVTVSSLTSKSFNSLKNLHSHSHSVFKEMESYLSTQLSTVYGVTNYQFTPGLLHSGLHSVSVLNANVSFSNIFNQTYIFGDHLHGNFHGSQFNLNGFLSFHSTLSTYYHISQSTSQVISSVYGYTNYRHHEYISTKYTGVLPHYLIYNSTYHDCKGVPASFISNSHINSPGQKIPSPYLVNESLSVVPDTVLTSLSLTEDTGCKDKCCQAFETIVKRWYSCLPTEVVITFPQFRLGILDINLNTFNALSSIFQVTSTSNFNLFLQINNFQSFNNMDIAMDENYTISNETTGQVKLMAAKILLQGVATGETSETAIQNPVLFETPLGKLDKLEFKIYADDRSLTPMWLFEPFELGINEWNATFQIDEEIAFANRDSGFSGNIPTLPIPNNPAALQYLALTSTNNPNNKSFP